MKTKIISIHAITLLFWLMPIVVYIYSQNNVYSCMLSLVLLFYLSITYVKIPWKSLFYAWGIASTGMLLFYGLFLHEGDTVALVVPWNIPLLSGLISWNSILYGFFLGGSLTLALFIFGLFSTFLRQQQPKFYLPGIWSNISILFSFLAYIVSFLFHHKENFQKKIKNKSIEAGRFAQAKLFFHDASFYALENAFSFAETLEMRGFSKPNHMNRNRSGILSVLLMVLLIITLVLYRISHDWMWLVLALISLITFLMVLKSLRSLSQVSVRYKMIFTKVDVFVGIWSVLFLLYCLYMSFHLQSFASKNILKDYVYFDWKIHGLFLIHGMMTLCFSHKSRKQ